MKATKSSLAAHLKELADSAAGAISSIGGDNYAVIVDGQVRAIVAAKECNVKEDPWVGIPSPMLDLLLGRTAIAGHTNATARADRAFIVVSHIPLATLIVVPLVEVLEDVLNRAHTSGSHTIRHEFHLKRVGYKKYEVATDSQRPNKRLSSIDSLEPIRTAIASPVTD